MTSDRDHELGALLRELPVPEHAPDFLDRVRAGIDTPVRSRRFRWRTLAAVGTAAAVFTGLVAVREPATQTRRPIAAVTVAQRMQAALATARTLRGELAVTNREGEIRYRFVTTDAGDVRITSSRDDLAYDASTGIQRSYADGFAGERRGIAPGPPDAGPTDWVLHRQLGATVRAMLAARDPRVTETTYDGRPAWVLATDVAPNVLSGDAAYDHLDVTVDQGSALPVRIVESRTGTTPTELAIKGLVVDGPVSRADFALEFPPGISVARTDGGFRRVRNLAEAASAAGYRPPFPTLPDGFELREIAVADRAMVTGVEGSNPTSLKVVSLGFHRGFDRVVVTTRLRSVPGWQAPVYPECRQCLPGSYWSDPLASGEGIVDRPEPVTVDGVPGQLLITSTTIPHVWLLDRNLVVTIAGDLTRAELLTAAASLV